MTKDIQEELRRILQQVRTYSSRGRIEELTYLTGAALATLESLGCPVTDLRIQLEAVIDTWANSDKAPVRS